MGDIHTLVSFTSRSSTRSSQLILEKNTLCFLAGGGEKEPFQNKPEYSVFLNKTGSQEKLLPEPNLREGKYPTSTSSSLPPGVREKLLFELI